MSLWDFETQKLWVQYNIFLWKTKNTTQMQSKSLMKFNKFNNSQKSWVLQGIPQVNKWNY